MDMKKLLQIVESKDSMKSAEKAPTGPKFTGYWKGTDSATPGNKMVGGAEESILKDLGKGPKAKTLEEELAEALENFMEDELGVEPKRPQRKGARPSREYTSPDKPSKRYNTVKEDSSQELNVGDDVIITGPVEGQGETGVVTELGRDGRFVIVQLYNGGKHSFNASDVEFNDYAGSDAEEAEMYDRDPDARKWAHDLDEAKEEFNYKVTCDGYDKGNFVDKNDAIYSAQYMIYHGEKEYKHIEVTELSTHKKIWEWNGKKDVDEGWESGPEERSSRERDPDADYDDMRQQKADASAQASQAKRPQTKVYTLTGRGPNMEPNYKFPGEYASQAEAEAARERLMANPKTPNPRMIGISTHTKYLDENNIDETKDVPVISAFRRGMEKIAASGMSNDQKQAAFDKLSAEFHKNAQAYSNKVKGKRVEEDLQPMANPQANQAQNTASTNQPNQQQQVQTMNALNTMKSAVPGTSATPQDIGKALDDASQGKPVNQQDMAKIKPMMDVMKTAGQDPKVAQQFKNLATQARQSQMQQNKG